MWYINNPQLIALFPTTGIVSWDPGRTNKGSGNRSRDPGERSRGLRYEGIKAVV